MKLADLEPTKLRGQLSGDGLFLRSGPFTIHLHAQIPFLAAQLHHLYAHYPLCESEEFADFHVRLEKPKKLRRWWRPQVLFLDDGQSPFAPFPLELALPLLEWGLNWCIATRAHQYLMLHAAVVEREGKAMLLSALPGAGKSTLCAALIHHGWRLLSDEFALVRTQDGKIVPLPRLIPLKNESIPVIRGFIPEAVLGPSFPKTRKGTVAHLRPPTASIAQMDKVAEPAWVVFPQYQSGIASTLETTPKAHALMRVAGNAFNYEVLGAKGFQTVANLIKRCDCYSFSYGDLGEAIAKLDALVASLHAD